MSSIIWHWFDFKLPSYWEVTGYSVGEKKGSLQCYTREGFVGELNWRKTKGTPDQQRIMSEVHRRHLMTQDPKADIPSPSMNHEIIGEFLIGYHLEAELFQASHFQKDTGMFLEWVFPNYQKAILKDQVIPLLKSYHPNNETTHKKWGLFGLSVNVPREFKIEKITPLPGHVVLDLMTPKRMHFTARRWALPEELLGPMDLSAFAKHLCRKLFRKVLDLKTERYKGYEAVRIEFSQKGQVGFERIVGQWWKGEILMWWDEEEQRINSLEQFGPKNQSRMELNRVWI